MDLSRATDPTPFADTGWGVLLDGLIGSVIGGLITAAALVFTLRHNRSLANDREATEVIREIRINVRSLLRYFDRSARIPPDKLVAFRRLETETHEHLLALLPLVRDSPSLAEQVEMCALRMVEISRAPLRFDLVHVDSFEVLLVLRRLLGSTGNAGWLWMQAQRLRQWKHSPVDHLNELIRDVQAEEISQVTPPPGGSATG